MGACGRRGRKTGRGWPNVRQLSGLAGQALAAVKEVLWWRAGPTDAPDSAHHGGSLLEDEAGSLRVRVQIRQPLGAKDAVHAHLSAMRERLALPLCGLESKDPGGSALQEGGEEAVAGIGVEACVEGMDTDAGLPGAGGWGGVLGGLWRAVHWTDLIAFPLACFWGFCMTWCESMRKDKLKDHSIIILWLFILALPFLGPLIFRASFQARTAVVFSCEPTGRYFTRTFALGWSWLITLFDAVAETWMRKLQFPECGFNPLGYSVIVLALDALEILGSYACLSQLVNCITHPLPLLYIILFVVYLQDPASKTVEPSLDAFLFALFHIGVLCCQGPVNRFLDAYVGWQAFWCLALVCYGDLAYACLHKFLVWRREEMESRCLSEGMIECCICLSNVKTVCIVPCLHKTRMPFFMDARVVADIQSHKRQIYHT